jgi:hypothetical protein
VDRVHGSVVRAAPWSTVDDGQGRGQVSPPNSCGVTTQQQSSPREPLRHEEVTGNLTDGTEGSGEACCSRATTRQSGSGPSSVRWQTEDGGEEKRIVRGEAGCRVLGVPYIGPSDEPRGRAAFNGNSFEFLNGRKEA